MQFKTFDIIPHDTKFDFVGKRHIAVTLSLIANLAVIGWAIFHGVNFGGDFAGGTEMEGRFQQAVGPYLIRVGRIALMTPEDVKRVVDAVSAKFPVAGAPHFNPDVGDKIDFQFQGTPPAPDALKAAVESAGVRVREVREEAGLTAGTKSFAVITQGIQDKIERDLLNLSINEVLGRTFLTSFATALSLVGLLVYGVGTIFDFAAAMLIGIISGTYSTWFIAAPMTIWLEERAEKKKGVQPRQPQ